MSPERMQYTAKLRAMHEDVGASGKSSQSPPHRSMRVTNF
jgi:hypothetical protein